MHKLLKVALVSSVLAFATAAPSFAQTDAFVAQIEASLPEGVVLDAVLLANLRAALTSTAPSRDARATAIASALNALLSSVPEEARAAVAVAIVDTTTSLAGSSAVAQQNARLTLQSVQTLAAAEPEVYATVQAELNVAAADQADFTPLEQAVVAATETVAEEEPVSGT